jgi:transcriptional regulator with XRE-family HTH domain
MAETPKAIGNRLRRTREALGLNQRDMAWIAGVSEGNWSQFENGDRRISLNAALRLRDSTNITLDWIYCGVRDGVPHGLALKLRRTDRHAQAEG